MAIFRRKQTGGETDPAGDGDSGFEPQPEKAQVWFNHAKTAADSSNHDYALACYANGIKFDPSAMFAHEAMYSAGMLYHARGGRPASSKEIRSIDDGTPPGRFAAAEFAWMKEIDNGALALKTLAAAIKAGQLEYGHSIATRVLNLLRRSKKLSKGPLLQAKDLFAEVGAWNEAIAAGEAALQIDPGDSGLAADLKDLSAQRAMDQGGYEDALKEGGGGFRKVVKDLDRQRELEEQESISGGRSVEERNLERARRDYEENPADPDAINKYGQVLRRIGTPDADQQALAIFEKGYAATNEYRFRMAAGDLRIAALKRALEQKEASLANRPDDQALGAEVDDLRKRLLQRQAEEYRERVTRYPTDRTRKFELGQVEFDLGNYESAMEQFQKAKDEPKLRVRAGMMLGRCFAAEGWHRDAIDELRDTLASIDAQTRDLELPIRYDLMVELIAQAAQDRSIDVAREALDICSGIMRKDIGFEGIRSRRKEIDALIKELNEPGS